MPRAGDAVPKRPLAPATRCNLENIPAELRQLTGRWVTWRPEWNEKQGKWTKPPRKVDGRKASTTNTADWADLAAVAETGRGVGFIIVDADDLAGADLDHVLVDGKLADWAADIVRRLDTYTEISPSGDGLRMFFRAAPIEGACKRAMTPGTGVELYTRSGRYLTVTGNHMLGTAKEVARRDSEFRSLHAELFPPKTKLSSVPRQSGPIPKAADSDLMLIARASAAANGAKFRALWAGDTAGYDSASEADLALANLLAWWCGGDPARVERLLRQSGLRRAKWDQRPEYLEQTITTALTNSGNRRGESDTGSDEDDADRRLHLTDTGNAERYARANAGDLLWDNSRRAWLVWTGTHWGEDKLREAERRAKTVARAIYLEGNTITNSKVRDAVAKWASKSESKKNIDAMLSLARNEVTITAHAEQFDLDGWKLNVANGTVDLQTGELHDHKPVDRITKCIRVGYEPRVNAPTWLGFLDRIFGGDLELIGFVQRAIGYSLTGEVREQCMFFLYGRGRNGKSTLLNVLAALLGAYWKQATSDLLLSRRNPLHGCELADLRGARLVTAIEADANRSFAEALFKQMTGGDPITARFMHGNPFTYRPTFKLWLAANHKPTAGSDEAMFRRIHLIPFDVTIPEDEVDPNLPARLEAELPGILAWAIEGTRAWLRDGLKPPTAVRAATAEYRSEQDIIGRFLEERCVRRPGNTVGSTELYQAFRKWLEDSGERIHMKQASFSLRVQEHSVKDRRVSKGKEWVGIALLSVG